MKIVRTILALLAVGSGLLLFSGCEKTSPYDTSIPWSRPADWEQQLPGVGNPG
ncbi:MAG: hypothetical protein P8L44_20805 [Opitutales bacterium]|jgi:hypothetical protein|nr:hypothetical protein [Opitutales bacterium]